ncbi:MAG: DUF2096 family protein [Candidatus Bathyarchaeia archaeon]|jgi:hypothetical protein
MAAWKTLEDLLIELRKKDVQIPANIMEDLRAARSMIELLCSEGTHGEAVTKAEQYTANVETYLIGQAQEVLEPTEVDEWFRRLEAANMQVETEEELAEDKLVVGVPRNQKWIRIETDSKLPAEYVLKLAGERNLAVNKQADGRLVVYGQPGDVKAFVKQVAAETAPKKP